MNQPTPTDAAMKNKITQESLKMGAQKIAEKRASERNAWREKNWPTAAATPRIWRVSEFNDEIVQDETGNTVAEAAADYRGTAADTAALIVRAVNLLEAHEAVAEAAELFNPRAFTIASCPRCDGNGRETIALNDACNRCGGTGEIVEQDILPDDLRKIQKALARLAKLEAESK